MHKTASQQIQVINVAMSAVAPPSLIHVYVQWIFTGSNIEYPWQ
jgi:hypothetical protein